MIITLFDFNSFYKMSYHEYVIKNKKNINIQDYYIPKLDFYE